MCWFGREYNEAPIHQVVVAYRFCAQWKSCAERSRTGSARRLKPFRAKGDWSRTGGYVVPAVVAWWRLGSFELADERTLARN